MGGGGAADSAAIHAKSACGGICGAAADAAVQGVDDTDVAAADMPCANAASAAAYAFGSSAAVIAAGEGLTLSGADCAAGAPTALGFTGAKAPAPRQ